MKTITLSLLAALTVTPALAAPTAQCPSAIREYNSAAQNLMWQITSYSNCVANSRGDDECASQFSNVQMYQNEFVEAVDDYDDECDS